MADESRNWLLAIDTSNSLASIALGPAWQDSGQIGAEITWNAGRHQTTTVLTEVDHVIRLAGIDVSALGAVAVATGPGAFNALRVGMSVAKGLAFSMDLPIFGVGTLDVAAHAVSHTGQPVRAFVEAGRGRFVVGDYRRTERGLEPRGALVHRTPEELGEGLLEPTLLAGELSEVDRERLAEVPNVILPDPGAARRRASTLLDLVVPRWRDGSADDLLALEPLYVHSRPGNTAKSEQRR